MSAHRAIERKDRTMARCKTEIDYFVDPVTGERFADDEKVDVHDRDLIGVDDIGMWWGTSRAAHVLSQGSTVVHVQGYCGFVPYQGWFIGTRDEAVAFATKRSVKNIQVEESVLGATAWIDQ